MVYNYIGLVIQAGNYTIIIWNHIFKDVVITKEMWSIK